MSLWKRFWDDDAGVVVSSEVVLLGTIGVVGATVGLNMLASSVNHELQDLAYSVRSLDQSYSYHGFANCHAWTAGSSYQQESVAVSLKKLGTIEENKAKAGKAERRRDDDRERHHKEELHRKRDDDRRKKSKSKKSIAADGGPVI